MIEIGPEYLQQKPDRVIDLSSPHNVEALFDQQFPFDDDLRTLHKTTALGLAARGCRLAYATRIQPGWLYGSNSQEDYYHLMRAMLTAGSAAGDETQVFTGHNPEDWQDMYTMLRADTDDDWFQSWLSGQLDSHRTFLDNSSDLDHRSLRELVMLEQQVRTASEILLMHHSSLSEDGHSLVLPAGMDPRHVRELSDEHYWRSGNAFSAMHNRSDDQRRFSLLMCDLHRDLVAS